MAAKEQVILRLNSQGVAHEGAGIEYQCAGHTAGYTIYVTSAPVVAVIAKRKTCALARECGQLERWEEYISGSFCVSITAAMGMPKLETGPQKSVEGGEDVESVGVIPFGLRRRIMGVGWAGF